MLKDYQKREIADYLNDYLKGSSLKKAANKMSNISPATLSVMSNYDFKNISDEKFRNVGSFVGWKVIKDDWVSVETRDFKKLTHFFTDAKEYGNVLGIVGSAGAGKSEAAKVFQQQNENCHVVTCRDYWNRKDFLKEMLKMIGKSFHGMNQNELMETIIYAMKTSDTSLIILDEVDKLPDASFTFFITFYNYLEDNTGIVLMATDHLQERLKRGIALNKKGYQEIYSRLGRKLIELDGLCQSDVIQICTANGIEDKATINDIWNDCEQDIRRVKRRIHAIKRKQERLSKTAQTAADNG